MRNGNAKPPGEDDEQREAATTPRDATMDDVKDLLGQQHIDVGALQAVFRHHPLRFLMPVVSYAMDLHEKRMFPVQRAFSEAFLAVPEADIAAEAAEFIRGVEKSPSPPPHGGGLRVWWERRDQRRGNCANYARHFLMVLHKFATALAAEQSMRLIERAMDWVHARTSCTLAQAAAVQGGYRPLRTLLSDTVTVEAVDLLLREVISPFYGTPQQASGVTYEATKQMQRLIMRRLFKILKGARIQGMFDAAAFDNARRITDMFYMTMCYTVVVLSDELPDTPEKCRFIRMYRHTTAYCRFSGYAGYVKLQFSFADSDPLDLLLCEQPDIVRMYALIGSNLVKHVNDKSFTAKLQRALTVLAHGTSAIGVAVVIGACVTATMGGALVPVLAMVGAKHATLVADVMSKLAKSSPLVIKAIRSFADVHQYRVQKRNSSQYSARRLVSNKDAIEAMAAGGKKRRPRRRQNLKRCIESRRRPQHW